MTTPVITPPHTYAEWSAVLDKLKERAYDQEILQAMINGTIQWQSGVAERFSQKLIDVINFRMNQATDQFQKEMNRAQGREKDIIQALLHLRRELSFLTRAMNLPVIPEKDRGQYYQLVIDQANKIQTSLEDSVKVDRSGKLASIVRNNKVNAIEGV